MRSPIFQAALLAAVLTGLASCQSREADPGLPPRDETVTFFGAGRERLDWNVLPAIGFDEGSWVLSEREQARLDQAARLVAQGRRLLLIGVGDDQVPAEHGRQQGLARAVTVRRALVGGGGDPSLVQATGLAADERAGLDAVGSGTGPRVECVVVR
jgi:hypothetical protein